MSLYGSERTLAEAMVGIGTEVTDFPLLIQSLLIKPAGERLVVDISNGMIRRTLRTYVGTLVALQQPRRHRATPMTYPPVVVISPTAIAAALPNPPMSPCSPARIPAKVPLGRTPRV
jgi:hypothetical protein